MEFAESKQKKVRQLVYYGNCDQTLAPRKNLGEGLGIVYIPKPSTRPNTYTILGTLPKHVYKSTKQAYKSTVFRKKIFFLTKVYLYFKMCRIKFKQTFRMNVGLSDFSKNSYLC